MSKRSTRSAGIDTGKHHLDIALYPGGERLRVENTSQGHEQLLAWLDEHSIRRVGIEASGDYETAVVRRLRRARKKVAVLQPRQVRAFAQFKLQRAKTDRIDAYIIAQCTAAMEEIRKAPDERFAPFAKHLLFIEQLEQDIACQKNRREHFEEKRYLDMLEDDIKRLQKLLARELALLRALVCKQADLAHRLKLIESVDGVGPRTALALLILLPELGALDREHISSLVGLAPFDDESGQRIGQKHIAGGRARVRKALYAAALPASFQWNDNLKPIYKRLIARNKPHQVALVACARKLLIYVNAVVTRGSEWLNPSPQKMAAI